MGSSKTGSDNNILPINDNLRKVIFIIAAILCLTPFISPPFALLMGLVIAQLIGHPYLSINSKATGYLLRLSVIGLGFGMNIESAMKAGMQGVAFTTVSIIGTLLLGALIGKWFKLDKKASYLISSGTAICGGSAIAAISPIIQAEEKQISVALGSVFILNSIALLIFPYLGHAFNLSQSQFGLWCAIAIHDTSSVVGAASKYGNEALGIATTVKLARALWIIPLAFFSTFLFKAKSRKIKIPYFIGWYIVAMAINTYLPFVKPVSPYIVMAAKAGLTLTLFLIGAGLNRKVLRSVGIMPFFQAVILWIVISVTALISIMYFA